MKIANHKVCLRFCISSLGKKNYIINRTTSPPPNLDVSVYEGKYQVDLQLLTMATETLSRVFMRNVFDSVKFE